MRRRLKPMTEAYNRGSARVIRCRTDMPLILVGGLRSLATIEEVVKSGDADAVALCLYRVDAAERDDLFQEVFIKVHRAAASFDSARPLHPWLFTILANSVRTHLRRRRVRSLVHGKKPAQDPADPAPDSEHAAVARETVGRLEREISRLPLVKREVVLLACVEKLPLKEVAEALGLPLNTVKTHLRRARLTLAEALARHDRAEVSP